MGRSINDVGIIKVARIIVGLVGALGLIFGTKFDTKESLHFLYVMLK